MLIAFQVKILSFISLFDRHLYIRILTKALLTFLWNMAKKYALDCSFVSLVLNYH